MRKNNLDRRWYCMLYNTWYKNNFAIATEIRVKNEIGPNCAVPLPKKYIIKQKVNLIALINKKK